MVEVTRYSGIIFTGNLEYSVIYSTNSGICSQVWTGSLNLSRMVVVPFKLMQHLNWGKNPLHLAMGQSFFPQPVAYVLIADTSGDDWGGVAQRSCMQGKVDTVSMSLAYNCFEMLAVWLSC